MLNTLQSNLAKFDIDSRDKVLLALSGGLDSVVLLHALVSLGFEPEVVHCNFKLRGKAADEDEQFCKALARRYNLIFHQRSFATQAYAEEKGLSIQMAARELRYGFFEELDTEYQYRAILTAHHADDQIETVLFKLARGSALAAVAGIREKRQKYLRPLLNLLREELEAFAKDQELQWREDLSNADTKYLRNAYRHKLLPLWQEIQADLKPKILESSRLLREQDTALEELLSEKLNQYLKVEAKVEWLDIEKISGRAYFPQLLYQWLHTKGDWDWKAVNFLYTRKIGRYTENERYLLYHGRQGYELHLKQPTHSVDLEITAETRELDTPIQADLCYLSHTNFKIDARPEHHYLDADLLKFPLKIRNWQEGDRFQPLGMSGTKKVSDYLIDIKMPLPEKSKQLVLESDGEIVALLGHRIDHRFRITNSTKTIYFVRLKK